MLTNDVFETMVTTVSAGRSRVCAAGVWPASGDLDRSWRIAVTEYGSRLCSLGVTRSVTIHLSVSAAGQRIS